MVQLQEFEKQNDIKGLKHLEVVDNFLGIENYEQLIEKLIRTYEKL